MTVSMVLGFDSELCLAFPEEFCWKEKEGIPNRTNDKHKVLGKEGTNGFEVEYKQDSFPASADMGLVEAGKESCKANYGS